MTTIPSDPVMLLSFINMKLRDEYPSLEELCRALDIDESELREKLRQIDYEYIPAVNQFR
ncbi:MAG: DUF4250 domain-containing protein [Candidatus Amulumruptor caecigallinarius]|nr:DUF4250 domain-containing protein [Candidatus Amulumruptor caecigallinarius]MCM1397300.1 DUF4250 domain-containing protein [Candidatus Amulumruptor caecigallinarius]MCM1453635.1 DUF4250 domain-containing protein [bacterium]